MEMLPRLLQLVLLLALCGPNAGDDAKAPKQLGPYAEFANSIASTKKGAFQALLKRMREIKNKPVKTEADAKLVNATRRNLNREMQTLLGDADYQKYRGVRTAHTKKLTSGGVAAKKEASAAAKASDAKASVPASPGFTTPAAAPKPASSGGSKKKKPKPKPA